MIAVAAFQLLVWSPADRSVLSRAPILDEAHYLRTAHELSTESWVPDRPFYMSPLYSYLVAATGSGRAFDDHRLRQGGPPTGIRVLQVLCWLATAWLLRRVGRDLLGDPWGWAPPALWILYRPAAILASQTLLEVPLAFAATATLSVAGGWAGPRDPLRRALLAGALVGAAALLRGTSLLLLVPAVLLLARGGVEGVARLRLAAVAAALVVFALPAIHNSTTVGRPVGPSLNGGVNLYIGNGAGANGFFRAFEGYDVEADPSGVRYLSQRLGRPVADAAEADRVWFGEARDAIVGDPLRTAGLWVRKVRLFLTAAEIPQISAPSAWLRTAPALHVLAVPYGLISALALAGAVLAWRSRPGLRPWLLAAALLIAAQSLFFVVTRYRLVFVPALALAAGAAMAELVRLRGAALGRAAAVVAVAVLAVVPWGLSSTLDLFATSGLDNEAVRWEHVGIAAGRDAGAATAAYAEAQALYRESLDRDPTRVQPWRGLGRVLWLGGDRAGAVSSAKRGLETVSQPAGLRDDLIRMLLQDRRGDEALPYLEQALADAPNDPDLLHNMSVAQAGAGDPTAAAATARRLVDAAPDDPRGYVDLGVILARAGRLEDAHLVFAAGLERVPGHPDLAENLARVEALLSEQSP